MSEKKYVFKMYSIDDEMVEECKRLGMEIPRNIRNDGSVPISVTDEHGDLVPFALVLPIAPRKRNTPYNAPDDERDALAQKIVDALNAYAPSQ